MRKLVLFDIDGTLITDQGAARDAYAVALREIYGYERGLRTYDFSGRTDPQITHMVLSDAGFDEETINRSMDELWVVYLRELAARANAASVRALEGVHDIVDRLSAMPEITLALLTGNIEPGARIKLTPPDLNRYFPFGAFGSDSSDRNVLAPVAVQRAEEVTGQRFAGRDVVIIGDSIYDVRCGVPHGALTIAVASGKTPAATLQAENPDHFFDDLRNADAVLAAILG